MPETDTTETTDTTENSSETSGGTESNGTSTTPETTEDKPSFDGPFDESRALALIENLRADLKKAKGRLSEVDKAEQVRKEAEMTELQKAQARAEAAEKALADAQTVSLKAAVAKEHGIPESLITATTEDEIKAQAKALADFVAESKKPEVPSKPKPSLKPGVGGGDDAPAFDPAEMAKRIRG